MTVVVNEFDVVPAPERAPAEPSPPVPAAAPGIPDPSAMADIERALRMRAERRARLEAY